jgi:hypothetical protein
MTAISGSALLTSVISTIPSPRELQRIETDGSLASKTVRPGPLETQSITFMLGTDTPTAKHCAIPLFRFCRAFRYNYAELTNTQNTVASNLECVSFRAFSRLPGFSTKLLARDARFKSACWLGSSASEGGTVDRRTPKQIVPVEPRTGMPLRPP